MHVGCSSILYLQVAVQEGNVGCDAVKLVQSALNVATFWSRRIHQRKGSPGETAGRYKRLHVLHVLQLNPSPSHQTGDRAYHKTVGQKRSIAKEARLMVSHHHKLQYHTRHSTPPPCLPVLPPCE